MTKFVVQVVMVIVVMPIFRKVCGNDDVKDRGTDNNATSDSVSGSDGGCSV